MKWKFLQSFGGRILTGLGLLETYIHLRNAWRQLFLEIKIDRRHRAACKRIPDILNTVKPLNLNFGCGNRRRDGWTNVDNFNSDADLTLDLRRALPFPDGCVDNIYAEYVLESFNRPDRLIAFLRECFRILKVDGIFSVAVTDFGSAFELYAMGDEDNFYAKKYWNNPDPAWCKGPIDELNYLICRDGKYNFLFDKQNLIDHLLEGGFSHVQLREFDQSSDLDELKNQSIYANAIKESIQPPYNRVSDRLQKNDAVAYDELWSNDGVARLYANPSRRILWRQLAKIAASIEGPVLDIGCGDGRLLALLSHEYGRKPETLYGVDYSSEAIRQAKRRISGANLFQSDIHHLNFPDNSFGIVIACETLEHTVNPSAVLQEGYRVIRSGGRLIITIPNGDIDGWEGHAHFWNEAQFREISREYPIIHFEIIERGHTLLFVFGK